jgi:hypothetical protein
MKENQRSALKIALVEFVAVFVAAVGWNLFRKTGESVLDAFGVAVIAAVFLYIFHHERPA